MSDIIGRITVPSPVASGLVFPLVSEYGYGFDQDLGVVVHRFGELDSRAEQRFQTNLGPQRYRFRRSHLSYAERTTLLNFFTARAGSWASFLYNVPNADTSTTQTTVNFLYEPLSFSHLVNAVQTSLVFVQVVSPSSAPSYSITETDLRFPGTTLTSALLSQVQKIIPLIHIRVRESAVPDIYLADRRCTIGGQVYLPRIVGLGEPGSDVILSQDIKGSADNVQFQFGNADRVMTALANDTDLKYAEIDWCLFHVNSGVLLQLWKGFILNFVSNGSANFEVQCSDGLYQTTQGYPTRVVSRYCWKTYNDGINCPWASVGASSSAVTAAGGDPTTCDYTFSGTNGCTVHGMSPSPVNHDSYFGGHPANPQGVLIMGGPTSVFGFGRNLVQATSIVSETVYGVTLPEIWCNDGGNPGNSMPVNALMIDYRDESDFADSLGIVGAGPIGEYTGMQVYSNSDGFTYIIAPMVDGFTPQGFKVNSNLVVTSFNPTMGLREVIGNDPSLLGEPGEASFSLGQGTPQVWGPERAAGTAFCEVRISKPSTIQPSTPDQHMMTVPISQGLAGFTWDAGGGTRTSVNGLTNVFWIAINSLLRALGLQAASSADQLTSFVLPSIYVGDGTGAAEIADTVVNSLVGTGTEVQFQFQGSIGGAASSAQTPFRDWLTQILNCGLGYYTWEFGQLKLGVRINASSVQAFTLGNMLFQSLELSPIDANFEHLIIDFADQAYQYQANFADYQDKTHAQYYGRAGAPLTSRLHSVGICTLSQALRIAATRTREEIGGINSTEWRNARNVILKTTILALSTEPGMVVSVTHPDVPGYRGTCNVSGTTVTWLSGDQFDDTMINHTLLLGGQGLFGGAQVNVNSVGSDTSCTIGTSQPSASGITFQIITGDFRIQKWQLLKDWSVVINGKTVRPSMYDLDSGPMPYDVVPAPLPQMVYGIPDGPAWQPYQVQAASNDAMFPGEWTFEVSQASPVAADGSVLAQIQVTGKEPVNVFSPGVGGPIIGTISQSATGGSISGGVTVFLSLVALDTNGLPSIPSVICVVVIPSGTNTNKITLSGVVWPPVSNLASYVVYGSIQDDLLISNQTSGVLTAAGGDTYTPNSIVVTAIPFRTSTALPTPYVSKLALKMKQGMCHGIAGGLVTSINTGSGTFAIAGLIGSIGSSAGQIPAAEFIGRSCSIVGRLNASVPFCNLTITAVNASMATFTVSQSLTPMAIGDAVIVRFQPSGSNSSTPTQLTDAGFMLSQYPGYSTSSFIGKLLRPLSGTGRGTAPFLITGFTTGSGGSTISWDIPFLVDSTTVFIIEEPAFLHDIDSNLITNSNPTTPVTFSIPIDNAATLPDQSAGKAIVVTGFTVDDGGEESADGDQPVRDLWIFGAGVVRDITSNTTQLPSDGVINADATSANLTVQLLAQALVPNQPLVICKIDATTNTVTILAASGDYLGIPGVTSAVLSSQGDVYSVKFTG